MSLEADINGAVEHLGSELKAFHTGRASVDLVEGIMVDAYGQKMRLKEVASLTIPEATQIAIEPWDKGLIQAIEKAVSQSDLGLSASSQGQVVRVNIPPLSSERREELSKVISKKGEEAKVSIRNARRVAIEDVEKQKSVIGEDAVDREKKSIEQKVEQGEKQVDALVSAKTQEIKGV